jgi:hypothetical protein
MAQQRSITSRAPLHFRVAALHRCEIELLVARPADQRRRRAAPKPDQHRRTAEQDQCCARRHLLLQDVHVPDAADAARQHDRLVIAADDASRIRWKPLLE